jgi:hypothetical protein
MFIWKSDLKTYHISQLYLKRIWCERFVIVTKILTITRDKFSDGIWNQLAQVDLDIIRNHGRQGIRR